MKTVLKISAFFITIVLLLSVSVDDKPIFAHIYDRISPATTSAQNTAESFFKKSITSTQKYSKKLFENSVPKMKDSVKSKLSSNQKEVAEPAERLTDEDKEQLDDLIKNH